MKQNLSIFEIGNAEPLPACRTSREWLIENYTLEIVIALKFFSNDSPPTPAIDHVRQCTKCLEWINRVIPKNILRRQSRLVQYCCSNMFVAVEETGISGKNRITFELYRGDEPCWKIGGVRSFISFCPWCGKQLPDKPFISD